MLFNASCHAAALALCLGVFAATGGAGSASAQERPIAAPMPHRDNAPRLAQALEFGQLGRLLHLEAVAQAEEMAAQHFFAGSGPDWRDTAADIASPDRIAGLLDAALRTELRLQAQLSGQALDPRLAQALDWLRRLPGQEVLRAEAATRIALLSPERAAQAQADFDQALAQEAALAQQLRDAIASADLTEPAIAATLNAALSFARSFRDGGGYSFPMDDIDLMQEIYLAEPEIRTQIAPALPARFYAALAALSPAEQTRFVSFLRSAPGRALFALRQRVEEQVLILLGAELGASAASHSHGRQL